MILKASKKGAEQEPQRWSPETEVLFPTRTRSRQTGSYPHWNILGSLFQSEALRHSLAQGKGKWPYIKVNVGKQRRSTWLGIPGSLECNPVLEWILGDFTIPEVTSEYKAERASWEGRKGQTHQETILKWSSYEKEGLVKSETCSYTKHLSPYGQPLSTFLWLAMQLMVERYSVRISHCLKQGQTLFSCPWIYL